MSGGDNLSRLGNLPVGYVTQAQLQESTEKIMKTVQDQLQAFADQFLSRLPALQAQPTTFAAPRHSASHHSIAPPPQQLAVQQVPPPETPYEPRQRRDRQKAHSEPLQPQPAPRALLPRRLSVREVTDESPGPGRRMPGPAAEASKHHRSERPVPTTSAHKSAGDNGTAHQSIADDIIGSTPFSDDIMKAPFEKFKMPTMEKYKREGDPAEHAQNYFYTMSMLQAPESTICQCFPITLTRNAKLWWNALERKSIGSFKELSNKFIHHFLADSKPKLPSHVLIQTKQEPGEDLRNYFRRFQAKRLELEDPGSQVAMAALIAGLRKGDMSKALSQKPIKSYEELMSKAHRYMNMEEAEAYKEAAEAAEAGQASMSTPAGDHRAAPEAPGDHRAAPEAPPAQQNTVPVPPSPAKSPQNPPRQEEPRNAPRNQYPRDNRNFSPSVLCYI